MTSLDRAVELEISLQGGLLKANYESLDAETGDRCKSLVIEYMRIRESVLGKDIAFIKQLTKVVRNILNSEPNSLDGLLEKYFKFSNEGIETIRAGISGYRQNNLISLESHLLADAGDAAKALFEKTQDISWAERWYSAYKKSADMTIDTEPLHSAHAYGFAGEAAKAVFEKTHNIKWAKRWYDATKQSADMTVNTEPLHSAHAYSFAGEAAKAVFEKTQDISWAERWYSAYKKSADMTIDTEPLHSAHAYGFAGEAAKAVFEKTHNIKWAKRWYDATKQSADMTVNTEPLHSAHAYSFAGDAAKALSRATRNPSWTQAAIDCYQQFLSYYKQHPNPRMDKVVNIIREDVNFLQRFIK